MHNASCERTPQVWGKVNCFRGKGRLALSSDRPQQRANLVGTATSTDKADTEGDAIDGGAGDDSIQADSIIKSGYLRSTDAANNGDDFADGGEGKDWITGGGLNSEALDTSPIIPKLGVIDVNLHDLNKKETVGLAEYGFVALQNVANNFSRRNHPSVKADLTVGRACFRSARATPSYYKCNSGSRCISLTYRPNRLRKSAASLPAQGACL